MSPLLLAFGAAVCGSLAGLATAQLVRLRGREAAAEAARTHAQRPGRAHAAWIEAPWLHAAGVGAASLALALLPALRDPYALSQALLLLWLLYPLAWVDAATLTVEPGLVVGGLALRAVSVVAWQPQAAAQLLGGALGGAGLLTLVGFAYAWLRKRDGLGEGDAAVLGLIGAFVGWQGLLPTLLLAACSGLLVGVPLLLLLRRPLTTPLPFAPFLCLGGGAVYLAQAHGWLLFGLLPPLAG